MKGKKFAFGETTAAGAHIVPRRMLEDEGVTIDAISPVFLKSQEKIISSVLKKEVAAGAVKEPVFEKFKELNLKVLKISDPIPNYTFCATSTIAPRIEREFINALLKLKPIFNEADKNTVKYWDPELRHGFILPPPNYIQDVLKLQRTYKNIIHENQQK